MLVSVASTAQSAPDLELAAMPLASTAGICRVAVTAFADSSGRPRFQSTRQCLRRGSKRMEPLAVRMVGAAKFPSFLQGAVEAGTPRRGAAV